jgi:hypothetical protein
VASISAGSDGATELNPLKPSMINLFGMSQNDSEHGSVGPP